MPRVLSLPRAPSLPGVRSSIRAALAAAGLAVLLPAQAFAFEITAVTVECFTDGSGKVQVTGTVSWSGASSGDTVLIQLEGRARNTGYQAISGYTDTVTYPATDFSIDVTSIVGSYDSFRVASIDTSRERSRSFETDECATVIAEAPFAGVIGVTGGLLGLAYVLHRSRRRLNAVAAA